MRRLGCWLLLVLTVGCQKAERYGARFAAPSAAAPPTRPPDEDRTPLSAELLWQEPRHGAPTDQVVIEFVHADTDPEAWAKLPKFWNAPPLARPDEAATLIGLSPLAAGALAGQSGKVVRVKVPLGLDDPRPFIPSTNPPTLEKWQLGRRLFFDDSWLMDKPNNGSGISCATCHQPAQGFTDHTRAHRGGFNAPTLLNCVYNARQFWDGRAAILEEVIQRGLEDEREPKETGPFRHVWHGVIGRLRDNTSYNVQFRDVFHTEPTQDAVGRAIATYLRTILSGDSLHDRALRVQAEKKASELEVGHYEMALSAPGALEELGQGKAKPPDVAREVFRGYRLFAGLQGGGRTNCIECHSGRQFTDGGFHNMGLETDPPKMGVGDLRACRSVRRTPS